MLSNEYNVFQATEALNLHQTISEALHVINGCDMDMDQEVVNTPILLDSKEEKNEEIVALRLENQKLLEQLKNYEKKDKEYCRKTRCKSNTKKLRATQLEVKKIQKIMDSMKEEGRVIIQDYNVLYQKHEEVKNQYNKLKETITQLEEQCTIIQNKNVELGKDLIMGNNEYQNKILVLQNSIEWYKTRLEEAKTKCNKAIKCANFYKEQLNSASTPNK